MKKLIRLRNRPLTKQPSAKQEQPMSKSLVSSKTFWVNLLGGTVAVLTALGTFSFLPATLTPWIVGGLAVANVLLRIVTNQPINGVVSVN